MSRKVSMPSKRAMPSVGRPNCASVAEMTTRLAQFGLPTEGIALLLGIDTFLDMGRSATNAVGNSIATAVVAKWEGELLPEAQAEANALTLDTAAARDAGLQPSHA